MASVEPDDHPAGGSAPMTPAHPVAPSDSLPASTELPVAVFRPAPAERVLVAGLCHARALCSGARPGQNGMAAVFVDPCGVLLAIATAPQAVIGALLVDPAPFARLTELLGASRVYIEVPAAHARAVAHAVEAALWPTCVKTEVLPSAGP